MRLFWFLRRSLTSVRRGWSFCQVVSPAPSAPSAAPAYPATAAATMAKPRNFRFRFNMSHAPESWIDRFSAYTSQNRGQIRIPTSQKPLGRHELQVFNVLLQQG